MGDGPEFIAKAVRDWIDAVGAKTAFIEPSSPRENGYCESFNSKLRDELLDGEIFYALAEARVVIEGRRVHYNTVRPHSSPGYRPPAPEAIWPSKRDMSATPLGPNLGTTTRHALRLKQDHPIGAGQDFAIKVSLPGMDHGVAQSLIDGSH